MDGEVLDRGPSLFLLLGGIWAIMQLISIMFIRDPTTEELQELKKVQHVKWYILDTKVDIVWNSNHDMT